MSTGAFTLADIDKPKGKFSPADIEQPKASMQFTYPAAGPGGMPFTTNVTPEEYQRLTNEGRDAREDAGKQALVALGAMAAPALLPAMEGGGLLGFLGRVFVKAGFSGLGAGAGNAAGQAATGQNPLSSEQLKETAKVAGWTAGLALPLQALGELPATKLGRGAINESVGASGRDVTYGNPARAINREEIQDIATGDWNSYQEALRSGKTPTEAAQAAGGRFASVSQRINELTPRLGRLLTNSPAKIPVANVIDQPLEEAATEIIKNPAMGDSEKMAAIGKLGELQKSLKEGLGTEATPSQLQVVKQAIGNRVNWGGTSAVTDDVKSAYRSVYGTLKEAIHRSVPGSAEIDNRLTDLLATSSDLETLAKAEEVGRGSGITSGKIGNSLVGMVKSAAGRFLPTASNAPAAVPTGATIGEQLQSKGIPPPQPNTPTLPFHPGAGVPKP